MVQRRKVKLLRVTVRGTFPTFLQAFVLGTSPVSLRGPTNCESPDEIPTMVLAWGEEQQPLQNLPRPFSLRKQRTSSASGTT